MEVFILSKLFGNSSKSHLKVVGDFRDLYHNLWARMVVFIWGVGTIYFIWFPNSCVSELILQLM